MCIENLGVVFINWIDRLWEGSHRPWYWERHWLGAPVGLDRVVTMDKRSYYAQNYASIVCQGLVYVMHMGTQVEGTVG